MMIRQPGLWTPDLSLAKNFAVTERFHLVLRADAYNSFNHPNWQNPSTNITDSSVGVITSDGGVTSGSVGDRSGARAFRMGLRLQF